tara:strand:- start:1526 stop:1687 length:162 start_codon:yes stop_codon:yes gene_type:complete
MILFFLFFVVAFYFFYKKNNRETFISSDKFRGEKKGYVFKKDTKGLGYYQDIF